MFPTVPFPDAFGIKASRVSRASARPGHGWPGPSRERSQRRRSRRSRGDGGPDSGHGRQPGRADHLCDHDGRRGPRPPGRADHLCDHDGRRRARRRATACTAGHGVHIGLRRARRVMLAPGGPGAAARSVTTRRVTRHGLSCGLDSVTRR